MKKKMLIICVVMMLAVGVWGLTRPEALGNITRDFAEPTTSTSTISFSGEENDKIILFCLIQMAMWYMK